MRRYARLRHRTARRFLTRESGYSMTAPVLTLIYAYFKQCLFQLNGRSLKRLSASNKIPSTLPQVALARCCICHTTTQSKNSEITLPETQHQPHTLLQNNSAILNSRNLLPLVRPRFAIDRLRMAPPSGGPEAHGSRLFSTPAPSTIE